MRKLILNSSQHKHPVGTDPWIAATIGAVDQCVRHGHEIVTSVGLPSWELSLWRAAANAAAVHILCPISDGEDPRARMAQVLRGFALHHERVTWHWVQAPRRGPKQAWARRDRLAVELAEQVLEVSVRPLGRLAKLLETCPGKRSRQYAVPFRRCRKGMQWERRAPQEAPALWPAGALAHLTRASDGPWPGEPSWRYYQDVAGSGAVYARSGFSTLRRIVREGRIRGSLFRARAGVSRVSFTACSPSEAVGMIRFRARYARYGFEPYAIVLSARAAQAAGARPVSYEPGRRADPFDQGPGQGGRWQSEREWRVLGDVDLGALEAREVLVVTATEPEARELGRWCPYTVRSFGYATRGEDSFILEPPGAEFGHHRGCESSKESSKDAPGGPPGRRGGAVG